LNNYYWNYFKHNSCNRLMAVPNTRFTEPLLKFMQELNCLQLIKKLAFYIDCVGKCEYKYRLTTCLRSCDMKTIANLQICRVINSVHIAWTQKVVIQFLTVFYYKQSVTTCTNLLIESLNGYLYNKTLLLRPPLGLRKNGLYSGVVLLL